MPFTYRPTAPIQWSWVRIQGPDTIDFLHRLTTVNVKALQVGQGQPGFFLNPQGKIKSYFTLWVLDKSSTQAEIALEMDAGADGKWAQEAIALMDQFHFGEKLTVSQVTDLQSAWSFDESVAKSETKSGGDSSGIQLTTNLASTGVRLFRHGNADFGKQWTTVWGTPQQLEQDSIEQNKIAPRTEVSETELKCWRITAVRPWINSEISETTNPLEVGLHRGISENKGCYPGQEVIEKIISLGAPAKRLVKISADAPSEGLLNGAPLKSTDGKDSEIGQITSFVKTHLGFEALAIVKKIYATAGLEVTIPTLFNTRAKITQIAPYA